LARLLLAFPLRTLSGMSGVRDFRELVCWQLSNALKDEVWRFTNTPPASRDFKYCDQIRDSAASAPRNISEGFGRYTPREFARFLGYARASLMETQNHLIDGQQRQYLQSNLYDRLYNLAGEAIRLTTNLMLAKQRQAGRKRRAKPRTLQLSAAVQHPAAQPPSTLRRSRPAPSGGRPAPWGRSRRAPSAQQQHLHRCRDGPGANTSPDIVPFPMARRA
jgi:four helix bundle protein